MEEEKELGGFFELLKRFMILNKKSVPYFIIAILLLLVEKILLTSNDYMVGIMIDSISENKIDIFIQFILIICIIQLFKLVISYQVNYRVNKVSEVCIRRMRLYTYDHITKAKMSWLDAAHQGDVLSRINGDLNKMVDVVNQFLTWQMSQILTLIISVITCFFLNWKLSLVTFIVIPVLAFVQFLLARPVAMLGEKRATADGKANAMFMDLIGGLTISKAFGLEETMSKKYKGRLDESVKANVKSFSLEFLILPINMILLLLPRVIEMAVGGYLVLHHDMSLGALISFIFIADSALEPIGSLPWMIRDMYESAGIVSRIFEVWDVETESEGGDKVEKENDIPVEFHHVTFGYNEDNEILHGIDFSVKKGEKVALVGTSGGGKSTILNLLAGFFEKGSGEIKVFGNDVSDWKRACLRKHMSYVGQDAFLFPGSIYENVSYGNQNATEEDIKRVIDMVGLSNLNIHEQLGERGVKLSGGQRQRVCIARALLKNASIVLLDEPTSALDTESEYYVNQAIEQLTKGKTSITIAHRLSSIRNVDRILCLDQGVIAEEGTHEQLMSKCGVYKSLYEMQEKEVTFHE